jgi:glutamyl-tRNA reductase
MDLLLVGASHRTAGVDTRGRLAANAARLAERTPRSVHELLVISTCHRVEVAAVASDPAAARDQLRDALAAGPADVQACYTHLGGAAVRHLSRVAAGLDSLIVGEAEISGQIRRAISAARERQQAGPFLDRVVSGVLRASGRARSETKIGQGVVSAATAAVSVLEQAWGSLRGRAVLVVGAGEAGQQALARLRRRRAERLLIASRSLTHASAAANKTGADIVPLDGVAAILGDVDGAIVATRTSAYVIDQAACARAVLSGRRLQIVDMSVPRAVDPAVGAVSGTALHTVDDLGDVVRETLRRRQREIPAVERIVAEEAARTYQQFLDRASRRTRAIA